MNDKNISLETLRINPDWAKLPLFDRSKWQRVRFGDVVENVNETERDPAAAGIERFIAMEHLEPGSLHVRTWGNVIDGTTFNRRCRPGQVLFGKRRAYQRKVAIAEFDAVVSGDIYVFASKDKRLLLELLPFICMSERFFNYAVETSAGSLSPRTNWSSLTNFEFDLPPLAQQRRLAEILWAIDASQQSQSEIERSIQAYFEVAAEHAFRTHGEKKRLAEVLTYISDGPFGSKLKTEHYSESGARVIRLQNIGDGHFNDGDHVFIADAYFAALRRYQVLAGDIIVAGLGDDTHLVGRAALVPASLGPAINKADCFCLRANSHLISNAFLMYFLNSGGGSSQVKAQAQGTTRMRVNVGNLKKIVIPVPPLVEQERIVAKLQQIESAGAAISVSIESGASIFANLTNHLMDSP